MDIGIGLPAATKDVDGQTLVEWARRAEQYPFSALGVIDRIVFRNYDSLIALAAAAAVTTRVRLVTAVLLAPLRTNTALLAKQAVTVDNLSGGRLVLGLGVGIREDDFTISGADYHHRGRFFDSQLDEMKRIWDGEANIGPTVIRPGGPELMIGGRSDPAIKRAARLGVGWTQGTGGTEEFARCRDVLLRFWGEYGRTGEPPLQSVVYYALGEHAKEDADEQLRSYYNFRTLRPGAKPAEDSNLTPEVIKATIESYAALGCNELIFFPCSPRLDQPERLAEVVF
jgi:alkanesulfonate monooxygenase SsuD/methylene tetrahydromethanopterin reductase-like flavin-dependent oxidoreductase (luciferase family)